jgi:hypothetical protein
MKQPARKQAYVPRNKIGKPEEMTWFWDNYFDRHDGNLLKKVCPVCENEEKSPKRKSCSVCGESLP